MVNTPDRAASRTSSPPAGRLRLADLLAALSLGTDLGMGQPAEEAIRTCLLATELGRRTDLPQRELADVYWTALLMHVGCTAFAHEQAALFGGDEIMVNAIGAKTDFSRPREAIAFLLELGRDRSPAQRARLLFVGLTRGERFGRARLRGFDRPVLLVTRTGTAPFLRRIHDLLAVHLPQARTTEMPAGHAPQLVSMDRFLAELARFHERAGRGTPPPSHDGIDEQPES